MASHPPKIVNSVQFSSIQEFNIRVPKNLKKVHHVMRFNGTLNVDFNQWKMVKMERENNLKEFRAMEDEMPKFGAGSEYNRELRKKIRRRKSGIITKKYKPEAQPWILKVGGKTGKKFKGTREGGVSENAAFYVFAHALDGAIEAYPLREWYNFQPIQRYKSLTAEEAEEAFGRRKKVLNYFSLMLRKRLKAEEEEHELEKAKIKGAAKKKKDLKISEMDEWIDSDDESDSEEDDEKENREYDSDEDKKKKKKGKNQSNKKKKKDLDNEAFEESDDGDEEGRELDYISDSSEDEPNPEEKIDKDMKSVAEEDALRKLLTSGEEDEDEDKKSENEGDKSKKKNQKNNKNKNKGKKKKKYKKKGVKDSSSEPSSDSSDSDAENKKKKKDAANTNPRSASPNVPQAGTSKRKKKPIDVAGLLESSYSPLSTLAGALPATFAGVLGQNIKEDHGITIEAVRRYLMRKPMTAVELLAKFKNKKVPVSSDQLVETLTLILKRINPTRQTIHGKMYLSINPPK